MGISSCNLIRYLYDPIVGSRTQKIGGWSKYFPNPMLAVVRALLGWEDTNASQHLAFGTENIGIAGQAQLGVITNGTLLDITPTSTTDNVTPSATTISGNSAVVVTDATTTGITSFDSVYIETHMAVGGLILFGLYQCGQLSPATYQIIARDVLGNPLAATSSTSTTAVANFTTTSGSNIVTVTLANHGYVLGSTYPVLVSTAVAGITLFGNYIVQSVVDANNFTIFGSNSASSSTSGFINGGNARFVYSYGIGAIPGGSGYGIGGYGIGGFGAGTGITPGSGTPISATDWVLDNFGEVLIAVPINGTLFQPIYAWNPLSGSPFATVISTPGAPSINDGCFVAMPQRQIVVWGSTVTGIQDPLLIRWSDVNNPLIWVDLPTNQAGQYRIPKGSRIVGAIQGPQQGLIWTDLDCWSMQFVGLQNGVYGFNEIGTGCGLISRKAAASYNGDVFWMGAKQFFSLTGDGVKPIPCPVLDFVYGQLDTTNTDKIRVAVNSLYNEIEWFFPTTDSDGEVAAYAKLNIQLGAWDVGYLARSAWIDQSVLGPPIGADPNSLYLYQHETSPDADGQALMPTFTTGYSAIGDTDFKTFVDQFYPDFKYGQYGQPQNATVQITLNTADYPSQTPQTYGPFTVTEATTYFTPRLRGRLLSITVSSSDIGSWWAMGGSRYRYSPDGVF